MSAQWQRANPAEHDYDDRWDYAGDGYLKIYVHRRILNQCDRCGDAYRHFFVSHTDWARVPLEFRSLKLCVDCYAAVS